MCAHQIKGSNFCFAIKLHGNIFIPIKCIILRNLAPFFAINIYLCKKTLNDRDPANKLLGDQTQHYLCESGGTRIQLPLHTVLDSGIPC